MMMAVYYLLPHPSRLSHNNLTALDVGMFDKNMALTQMYVT